VLDHVPITAAIVRVVVEQPEIDAVAGQ
jgi:hypothetical protein